MPQNIVESLILTFAVYSVNQNRIDTKHLFTERIEIESGSLSSQFTVYTALKAYDNDPDTFCHTQKDSVNTLTLNFQETFISDVKIVNRKYKIVYVIDRLNGAQVKLMRGGTEMKLCGTIDTLTGNNMLFRVTCNAPGNSLVIELANEYLHVAEVEIYGSGESKKSLKALISLN